MRIEGVEGVFLVVCLLFLLLDPNDGDGRWWIVWKRQVARGVDVVWMDWIEDRALRELGKRGSDTIVRVVVVVVFGAVTVLWWGAGVQVVWFGRSYGNMQKWRKKV